MKKEKTQKTPLDIWAKEIVRKTGFVLAKEIYRGEYYSPNKIRNLILAGQYRGKSAVLKIYDDPRLSDEAKAQDSFNKNNKSKILKAPEVYKYETASSKKGWLIMEKLPENGLFFKQPLKPNEREEFLKVYLEYRTKSSNRPTRPLALAENLPAHQFHIFRINRWLQLANDKEAELIMTGKKPVLKPKDFIPRYEKGLALINREFKNRKMGWSHGHFKPHEIFKVPGTETYYLTDFAHSKMYPEGYEFGFIIWADWIIHADWRMPYSTWRKGISQWLDELKPIAKKLRIEKFPSLMRASLAERCLGTILADVCATDRPRPEKEKRIALIYRFLDELL